MTPLEDLLSGLGRLLNTELRGSNNTCLIAFGDLVKIHVELDRAGENIVLGCRIGQLPAGKYRENMLIAALIANNKPGSGFFGYVLRNDELVLTSTLPLQECTPEILHETLMNQKKKALTWILALKNQDVPAPTY